ncbi:MAG: hypothetical protein PWQ63_23 [Methanolobus sp.]|jgi:hypothetical protein|nr:hypothetical protein [Methanolobus sp.]
MTENNNKLPYAASIIRLLQGNVFKTDEDIWNDIVRFKPGLKEYFLDLDIELFVNENDGYAFLRQKEYDDPADQVLPSLMGKRQLSYPMTILCTVLVKKLYESSISVASNSPFCSIDKKTIINKMKDYMPDSSNGAKIEKKIDSYINKAKEYGFIRELKTDKNTFEIRTIILAKINNEKFCEIEQKLIEYKENMESNNGTVDEA